MENYEQKYKAALGWMQGLYNGLHGKTKEEAERFFPELKESEDEKIKELLKHYLEVRRCQTKDNEEYINCNHFLAWLEKQESVEETPQDVFYSKKNSLNTLEVKEVNSEFLKKYFEETPQEELDKEWKEIEPLNDIGPNVLEYADKIKNG